MSEGGLRDLETGQDYEGPRYRPVSLSLLNRRLVQSQGETNFVDSSEPLFSMYSKAAEEQDNKMVNRWRKDADEILIFTGLFSAAVAALLAVSVQNLIPSSQDISAFHLGNIYELLADPNATRTSIPSSVAKPPPFSPPRYAIWVNSLWFLSFVISLTCALLASSTQQWARRYVRVTQPAGCSPEKRARIRAFFANGVDILPNAWVVEGLPTLLHLSLSLFFAGLAIFLFNINREVFSSVFWWIGFFSIVYVLITLVPLVRRDSAYYSPLSLPAWFLYAGISYLFLEVLFSIVSVVFVDIRTWGRLRDLKDRYRGRITGGVEKAADEMVSDRPSDIDVHILSWTIDAFADDDKMEKLFEVIPGFLNSKLVTVLESDLPNSLLKKFWVASNGFFVRALLSNSVVESVKSRRLDIGMTAMSVISTLQALPILSDILSEPWDQVPQNVEMGRTMARWRSSENKAIAQYAECMATRILASVQERDDRWIALAIEVLGLSEDNLRRYVKHGNDSVSLAILISLACRHVHPDFYDWGVLLTLSEINIHNTLAELRHDFCTLWNESVQKASDEGPDSYPVVILRATRFLYIELHAGTKAVLRDNPTWVIDFDEMLFRPWSYPKCNILEHYPDSTTPSTALHVHTIPHPTGGSRSNGIAATRFAAPDIGQTSFAASPAPPFPAPILNESLTSHDAGAGAVSTSKSPHLALSAISSVPPSNVPSLADIEPLATLSGTTLSSPTAANITPVPPLRARGLINEGNMCFANAVLQLLVYCPPFWNQIELMGHRTVGGTTGLVDATVRFLDEFVYNNKPPLVQKSLQLDEKKSEEKNDIGGAVPFLPTYVYDAMKEKRRLHVMLDGQQQDAEEFFSIYLETLDEELLAPLTSISTHKPPASATLNVEELKEASQSREGHLQAEVGKGDNIGNPVNSSIAQIFEGKFRTTVRMVGQPDTITSERWRSLKLDIQADSIHTVPDALSHFSRPHFMQAEPPGPSPGKANQEVTVLIEALPPVLVIHLKRFWYDETAAGVVKTSKHVQISPELDIPLDVMAPTTGQTQAVLPARYTLCGVLYHHGTSANGGHYTVDVLQPNAHSGHGGSGGEEGTWLHIDDESVSAVRHEDVFGRHGNEWADGRCAYLLFYRRTATTWAQK